MNLRVDPDDLAPLVRTVVAEVLAQAEADRAKLNGRLGYSEAEASGLLGVPRHVLRDCRLRQEITARKVGRKFIYSRDALMKFLGEKG